MEIAGFQIDPILQSSIATRGVQTSVVYNYLLLVFWLVRESRGFSDIHRLNSPIVVTPKHVMIEANPS